MKEPSLLLPPLQLSHFRPRWPGCLEEVGQVGQVSKWFVIICSPTMATEANAVQILQARLEAEGGSAPITSLSVKVKWGQHDLQGFGHIRKFLSKHHEVFNLEGSSVALVKSTGTGPETAPKTTSKFGTPTPTSKFGSGWSSEKKCWERWSNGASASKSKQDPAARWLDSPWSCCRCCRAWRFERGKCERSQRFWFWFCTWCRGPDQGYPSGHRKDCFKGCKGHDKGTFNSTDCTDCTNSKRNRKGQRSERSQRREPRRSNWCQEPCKGTTAVAYSASLEPCCRSYSTPGLQRRVKVDRKKHTSPNVIVGHTPCVHIDLHRGWAPQSWVLRYEVTRSPNEPLHFLCFFGGTVWLCTSCWGRVLDAVDRYRYRYILSDSSYLRIWKVVFGRTPVCQKHHI